MGFRVMGLGFIARREKEREGQSIASVRDSIYMCCSTIFLCILDVLLVVVAF